MKKTADKNIFISYRVQDTAGETGRLVDDLKQQFADEQLFMDIENLEPGADFTEAIERSLGTCDVFLAVIGPRWMGEGDPPRIHNENDWVRLEVSTALRRNIRVVPVLVDGGCLPAPDQLPTDLQPLLRRQAIEITNKRWRYDTDQLIQFLIHTAGIEPLKAKQETRTPEPTVAKKSKTWKYIAAGFVLAFIILAVIGALLNEEKSDKDEARRTVDSSAVTPVDNTPSMPVSPQSNRKVTPGNITGRWLEVDEGETSTFVFNQNGNDLDLQVELAGQVISTGKGKINGRTINADFVLFGMPTVLNATLSNDGNAITGNYAIQANGTSQPIRLVRK